MKKGILKFKGIKTRRGIVARFSLLNAILVIVTLLSVFVYLYTQQQNYRTSIAEIASQSVNLTFANSVDRITSYNSFINSGMRQKLEDVNNDLSDDRDNLRVQDIESIRQKHEISEVVVVNSKGKIINFAPPDLRVTEESYKNDAHKNIVSELAKKGKGEYFITELIRKDDYIVYKKAFLNIGKLNGTDDVILIIKINIESTDDFNSLFTSPESLENLNLTQYVKNIKFTDVEDKYKDFNIEGSRVVDIENKRSQTYVTSVVEDYTGELIQVNVQIDFSNSWNRTILFGFLFLVASLIVVASYYIMIQGVSRKNEEDD
jgi:hypothetical protein